MEDSLYQCMKPMNIKRWADTKISTDTDTGFLAPTDTDTLYIYNMYKMK